MKSFTYKGNEYKFTSETGIVLSQSKFSETHVSGGGSSRGGVRVNSTVVTNHDIWLQKEDGTELSFHIEGVKIPLREGQKVTFVQVGSKDSKQTELVALVNHNTSQHWYINSPRDINHMFGISKLLLKLGVVVVLWFVVHLIGYNLYNSFSATTSDVPSSVAAWIICAVVTMQTFLNNSKVNKELTLHIENLISQIYEES